MQCPACPDTTLLMSDRQGVEIDYCPKCRGVWLDRGELDKLIQLGAGREAAPAPQHRPDFQDSDFGRHRSSQGYRRKSWLNEIFD